MPCHFGSSPRAVWWWHRIIGQRSIEFRAHARTSPPPRFHTLGGRPLQRSTPPLARVHTNYHNNVVPPLWQGERESLQNSVTYKVYTWPLPGGSRLPRNLRQGHNFWSIVWIWPDLWLTRFTDEYIGLAVRNDKLLSLLLTLGSYSGDGATKKPPAAVGVIQYTQQLLSRTNLLFNHKQSINQHKQATISVFFKYCIKLKIKLCE